MNKTNQLLCPDEEAMRALGAQLVASLSTATCQKSTLITLSGELGAGKSVLARAMIHAAGYSGHVKSPTYTLLETYEIERPVGSITRIAHMDLYRLADPEELHFLGFDDVLRHYDLVLIEWPDKAGALLPEIDLQISIEYALPAGRSVTLLDHRL